MGHNGKHFFPKKSWGWLKSLSTKDRGTIRRMKETQLLTLEHLPNIDKLLESFPWWELLVRTMVYITPSSIAQMGGKSGYSCQPVASVSPRPLVHTSSRYSSLPPSPNKIALVPVPTWTPAVPPRLLQQRQHCPVFITPPAVTPSQNGFKAPQDIPV